MQQLRGTAYVLANATFLVALFFALSGHAAPAGALAAMASLLIAAAGRVVPQRCRRAASRLR